VKDNVLFNTVQEKGLGHVVQDVEDSKIQQSTVDHMVLNQNADDKSNGSLQKRNALKLLLGFNPSGIYIDPKQS
jgi:hypothetical protein